MCHLHLDTAVHCHNICMHGILSALSLLSEPLHESFTCNILVTGLPKLKNLMFHQETVVTLKFGCKCRIGLHSW